MRKVKIKKRYLEFVLLTTGEFSTICSILGPDGAADWIEELNDYLGQSEKNRRKYDSHYHTIRAWSRRAGKTSLKKISHTAEANIPISALRKSPVMPTDIPAPIAERFRAMCRTLGTNWPRLNSELTNGAITEEQIITAYRS